MLNAIPAAELKPGVEYTAVVGRAGDLVALFASHDDAAAWADSPDPARDGVVLIEVRAVP